MRRHPAQRGAARSRAAGAGTALLTIAAAFVLAGAARGSSTAPKSASGAKADPVPQAAPVLIGTAREGNRLATSQGKWKKSPSKFAYQWQRCHPGCAPIAGATTATYALAAADVGAMVKATVTASNSDGSTSVDTAAMGPVTAAPSGAPENTAAPTISGTAKEGHALSASGGSWIGSENAYAYQWLRCDASGAGCSAIASATGLTHVLTTADAGATLRVTVTATNKAGSGTAVSPRTGTVVAAAKAPSNTKEPSISGTPRDNNTIKANPGRWDGDTPITFTYQWERCDTHGGNCAALGGKTGRKYKVRSSDEGHTLRVLVTAHNAAGTGTALSNPVTVQSPTEPRNTSRPSISGNLTPGQVLTASPGAWDGTAPLSFSFQWQRCDANGQHCSRIQGATGQKYKVAAADAGHRMAVQVAAKNRYGTDKQLSSPTAVVQPNAPINTSRPAIAGTPRQGSTLTTNLGTWSSPVALSFYYQWARCDASGNNCAPITGASHQTYALGGADVGHRLIVQVKAQNSRGSSYADSSPTAVIAAAPVSQSQTVSIGSVSLPDRLVIDKIDFSPDRIRSRQQPLVARFHVRETVHGKSVSGALVYGVAVPFNRLSPAPEVQTDGQGWATMTFNVKPTFPIRKGYLVVMFVRARKPGGNVLAGVSTRRLVSVRVG